LEAKTVSPWIQIRASEDEKVLAKQLADDYGTDVSNLVRALLQYADKQRPTLTKTVVMHGGKVLAPEGVSP
jgi:hypothetical protein